MDSLSSYSQKALDYVVELLKQELGYLIFYESKVEDLNKYVEDLQNAKDKVQHQIDGEKRNGKEIEAEVEIWQEKVDEIIAKHERFKKDENHKNTGCTCSNGLFPNLWSRYTLGRRAYRMAKKVKELRKKSKFDTISWLGPMSMDWVLSTIGYESFKSRKATIDKITKMLEDSHVRMIGVYGLGGVGKTTLVKEVGNEVQGKFKVLMASVTKNPDQRKIQGEIADILGLKLEEESEIGRADRIRHKLKKDGGNIVIILDDLWVGTDLNKLGIPFDDDDFSQKIVKGEGKPKINHNKMAGMHKINYTKMIGKDKSPVDQRMCKILLTSRFKEVLSDQMGVHENSIVHLDVLEEKEAETLFKKVARVHDKHSIPEPLVTKIAEKCGRLPISIVTVGRALRDKSEVEWNDSLQQLERQEFVGLREPLEFSTRLSFNHLENEELKSTFLICAQLGPHPLIMDLVKYCFGLGILQRVHTIKEARDRMLTLIRKLKRSSLLLDSDYTNHFNMHDMVRDIALSISRKEQHFFTMRDEKLDEWPEKDELERYTSIFLHNCDVTDDVPKGIAFPQLKVFHIDGRDPSMKIPSEFKKGNTKLKVLILTGICVPHLPFSDESLPDLRMLCLEGCQLGKIDLSIIGKLKKLKILSFSGSEIENLPNEVGDLSKLQLFDISNCFRLRVIPPNVISRLDSLEELYMRNSPIQWGFEEQTKEIQNASLAELSHLHQLTNLDVSILDATVFPRSLFLDKLDSYKIVIGDSKMLSEGDFKMPNKYEVSRTLALQLKEGINIHTLKGVKMLLKRVEYLFLGELNGVQNVFYELNLEGFPCLKHFSIVNNSDIQCIIDSKEMSHDSREMSHAQDAFPNLESMYLHKLKNMKTICCSALTKTSFCKLKIIKIKICAQLENIFSFSMVRLLEKLETMEVSECHSLEKIVFGKENANNNGKDANKIEFPRLHSLTLQSMPAFTSFYTDDHGGIASVFNAQVNIPNLKTLELSSINQIQKIWSSQPASSFCFENLVTLNVKDCNGLTYLFTFSEAEKLKNLKSISVSECCKMEQIFELETEDTKVVIFPKLEEFHLTSMVCLSDIFPKVSQDSFPNLSSVGIEECGKLVKVFPRHMVGRFRRVENLKIVRCFLVEDIFDLEDAPQTNDRGKETNLRFIYIANLPNLKHVWNKDPKKILRFKNMQRIEVYYCDNLENLFPPSLAKGLEKLDSLTISGCPKLHEIAWKDGSETGEIHFKFPLLTSLTFVCLLELKSFYPGSHSLEWPSLKKLTVESCDKLEVFTTETASPNNQALFLIREVVSNLELMAISQKEAERLKSCIRKYRMHQLKELQFFKFQDIDILYWFLHRIPNLERLRLYGCQLKEVLPNGSLVAHEIGNVVQIKELTLDMPTLEKIGFEHDLVLQRLESLVLLRCFNLIYLAHSTVTFTHLKSLEVSQCDKLSNLMSPSTAKSLVKLTKIKVDQCKAMEKIIAKDGNEEERVDEIVFSKLMTLELVSLKNLTSFCNFKNPSLNFPVLEKVIVIECPKIKTFSVGLTTAPILRHVYLAFAKEEEEGKWCWEGDLNATIRKISEDMVPFENAEHLELSDYPKLEEVWHGHGQVSLRDNCFHNLKILKVNNCDFLSSAIPLNLLLHLKNLEELQVRQCNLVEVIFDMNETNTKTEGMDFHLKILSLENLPNLKHVWNKDPQGCISFHNLNDVFVYGCKRLRTLFPKSLAKRLLKLESICLQKCRALEEIIGKEDAAADGGFEFPCLGELWLDELPELKCFYHLKCPVLKCLEVYRCGKLEIFTSESQNYNEAVPLPRHQNISIEARPPFSNQEVIPILTTVTLKEEDYEMLRRGGFWENLDKLKFIGLSCFHSVNETDDLPFEILEKVPNLETLLVACSGFKQIFFSGIFAQLKELELWLLPRLNSIGSKHSSVDSVLEDLRVHGCPSLIKLMQSSVSFSNLKELHLDVCDGLVHLFTSSAVKSLVRLEEIHVKGCESITEIVAEETDDSDSANETLFEQLKLLDLNSLPSLQSFYSGSSTLKFPCLEDITINQCPRMKTFSNGIIEAPVLRQISASIAKNIIPLTDDLSSTIDKLFNEKLHLAFMEDLKLSNFPELKELWLGETPLPANCFSKLTTLVVENCEFLLVVIPSNLLPYLKNLEELRVRNCSSVEVIFDMNGMETSETEEQAFFLKKLTLDQLPNLKLVWNKNPKRIMSFEKLQKVKVSDCESLQYLFPAASMARHLLKLKVQNCGALEEILGKEDTASEASGTLEFPYLITVILNNLPELNCFYSGRLNLKCPVLKVLNAYHCGKLEVFTSKTKSNQVLPEDQVGISVNALSVFLVEEVIPKLEEVSLNEKEANEYQENFFHKITRLQLYCFHNVTIEENTLPYGLLHKVPNLEILAVACSDFKEILPSKGLEEEHIRMLSKLKGLRLEALPKLNSIGLEHYAASFSNLKELSVTKCHKLVYLFTSSAAKSLVQLRRMSIEKCESMKEIMAAEEEESTEDVIVFGQFTKLSLNNLSSLGCFYTGNSRLRFPYLQEVIIMQCSKMKVFSEGFVSAPQLPAVQVSLEKKLNCTGIIEIKDVRWEGDLNSTVKKLFKGKEVIVDS